ncbi:MAG TPA: sugar porter family MFS transporter [Kiritimatiellia bacterium]|nr:sugar porter family MFS transporter [Kiritimatiellia bacterium]HMO99847.1 sugar porter family MFS transporter [Kiritimatiellia bacterium]HMP97773.1 sugar porter family MFS transporter [Kiritimatiellia bacterium]
MNAYVILLSCVAALGGFLFGFDSGVINGTVSALQGAFGASDVGTGFNVASMLLGCAVGAFFSGRIADWFGRRVALLAAAACFAISAWGSGIASGSVEFVIYRLIGGLAVGGASMIAPAYISEVAPSAYRGRLTSLQQLAIVLGLFTAFLSNFLLARAGGGAAGSLWGFQTWQWMFWVELIPVALFFVGLLLIPESPRYLVARGKKEQAAAILARVSPDVSAADLVASIQKTLLTSHRPSLRDAWDSSARRLHPIVWIGILLAAFQQLVGINVIFYYGAVLWNAAGFTEENALLINVISGAINIGSTLVAIALIDRVGRKPLLVIGSVGMTVFLTVLGLVFAGADVDADGRLLLGSGAGWLALIAANCYIVCFGISWGPVMWVLLGEMFPNQMRGASLSLAGLSQWTANFGVTMTFPVLLAVVGLGGAYGLYAAFALLSVFFAIKFVRETKGKTLEEMTAG